MKPIECKNQAWLKRLGYAGMTVFPFIFYAKGAALTAQLKNHEAIHFRQQAWLLVLPFFLWYGAEYLVKRVKYKSHGKAYRSLSFEREAYANEGKLEYLKSRKHFAWVKYIGKQ